MGELMPLLRKFQVVGIEGVYAVTPITSEITPFLMYFVVTEDVESDGTWTLGLPLWPNFVETGPYRNVSSAPRIGAKLVN